MHELAPCTVQAERGAVIKGFVRGFTSGVLKLGTEELEHNFSPGQDVTVCVLDEVRGECVYAGFVTASDAGVLDVADAELLSSLQKRDVARVRVSIPVTGTVTPRGLAGMGGSPDGAASENDAADVAGAPGQADAADVAGAPGQAAAASPVAFTLLDVSAQGMRIHAHLAIATGDVIRFRFEELDTPFAIDAVVLRVEESRTGVRCGCRFTSMSPREQDLLFRYVLRTQGEQRRLRLNLEE